MNMAARSSLSALAAIALLMGIGLRSPCFGDEIGAVEAESDDEWLSQIEFTPSKPGADFEKKKGLEISYRCDGRRTCTLAEYVERSKLCALLVLRAGKAVHYEVAPGNQDCAEKVTANRYRLASLTKSITSVLFGLILANPDDNPLDLETPAADALSKAGIAGYPKSISVRELFHMSSGMRWDEDTEAGTLLRMLKPNGNSQGHKTFFDAVTARLAVAEFPWRRSFQYSGFDAQLIALLVEDRLKARRGSLATAFRDLIWRKLPTGQVAEWNADELEHPPGVCCLHASAHDIGVLGDWILQNYRKEGTALSAWLRRSAGDTVKSDQNCGFLGDGDFSYGYFWWVPPKARENEFTGLGTGGQYLHLFPDENVVIVQFGETNSRWCEAMRVHRALADAAVAEP
jgi:CubicO group peptidase (beta-lactamase class C family)